MKKTNLIFVLGTSPAILTETITAMHNRKQAIGEIHLITTRGGAKVINDRLFVQGGWKDFIACYPALSDLVLDDSCIHAVDSDDIHEEAEHHQMLELIYSTVRALTSQDAALQASIAGGRKTMSYYLGLAMNLLGRQGDTMVHVLVPEAWERDRNFLFPQPDQADLIRLIDIPFVRMRAHLGTALKNLDVHAIVQSAQVMIDMAARYPLQLDVRNLTLEFMGRKINLSVREFAIYHFFALQKVSHCTQPKRAHCEDCTACYMSPANVDEKKQELLNLRALHGGIHDGHYVRFEGAWQGQHVAAGNLPDPLRGVAKAIETVFGVDPRADQLKIRNIGARKQANYGLALDKTLISIK